ncbi:HEAT repeat domain-containing protein [Rhodopirellula sp. P2]|uniref:HEAT repeat domain-containing protein n=1 Tax=Rhodopirellula sp. P2 TaxID=2127060 RepID=UPI002367AC32|nr:HEAT repeat domain-containing protein [Rhodopirellula sp. P2]WDQ18933.1 HEAT repeat domain-containing protein [Rhodopirellula sp. P2]
MAQWIVFLPHGILDMWKHFIAGTVVFVVALSTSSNGIQGQEPAEQNVEADAPEFPSEIVDRLFEMAVSDPSNSIRRNALIACASLPNEFDRFREAVSMCLDSPDVALRRQAVMYLPQVDLAPERKVAAAMDLLEARFVDRGKGFSMRESYNTPALEILDQHSELAEKELVSRLSENGPMTVFYLELANWVEIDLRENMDHLQELSKSDSPEVRGRTVLLWSKYLSIAMTKRAQAKHSVDRKDIDPKMFAYAERIIGRYDQDGSGSLVEQEWQPMLMSPASADVDHDGIITVEEYAAYLARRSQPNRSKR